MADLATPTVTLSPDRTTATMSRGQWSQTVPVADLPKQRAFYAKLAEIGPTQEACYTPWLVAIDGVL